MDTKMDSIENEVLQAIIHKCIAEGESYYIGQPSDIKSYLDIKLDNYQIYNCLQRLKDKNYILYINNQFMSTWVATGKLTDMIAIEEEKIKKQLKVDLGEQDGN